jgi:DNA invertase Pin-like site-specific DNA recombinase
LTALGGLAEFERELIKARTDEGRRRAMEADVKLGRRSSLTALTASHAGYRPVRP